MLIGNEQEVRLARWARTLPAKRRARLVDMYARIDALGIRDLRLTKPSNGVE